MATCVETSGAAHETKIVNNNTETAIFLTIICSPFSKSIYSVLYRSMLFTVFIVLPLIFSFNQG